MYNQDKIRYGTSKMPYFQKYYRKTQSSKNKIVKIFYKLLFFIAKRKRFIELSANTNIGEGLYFGHAYGITINPNAKLGKNINLHKGVTIGQENRGKRTGAPTIGDEVWIGINSTIVGNITIGNNVLIAPNTYVNCDIPDNSIVFGNPCIIKHSQNATKDYINRKV